MHFASEPQGRFIDVIGQILIDWVISERLVDEKLVLHAALHVLHLGLQAINLLILCLATFHQLERNSLRLLQLLFDLEQERRAILVLELHRDLDIVLLLQSAL